MLARDVTSSPSSPAAESAPASASCRWRRGSACMAGREIADQALESQPVALGPEPRHHTHRDVGENGAAPLWFAGEDVRQVNLDERYANGEERVPDRQAGVRESRRVDDGAVGPPLESLDGVHQLTFVVGLSPAHIHAEGLRALARARLDLRQRRAAIQLRLPLTQQIEVRAVQHGDVY